jgi:hypothetical protein
VVPPSSFRPFKPYLKFNITVEVPGLPECRPPVWVQDNTLCLPLRRKLCGRERCQGWWGHGNMCPSMGGSPMA